MRLGGVDGVRHSGGLLGSARGVCPYASTNSACDLEGADGSGSDFFLRQFLVLSSLAVLSGHVDPDSDEVQFDSNRKSRSPANKLIRRCAGLLKRRLAGLLVRRFSRLLALLLLLLQPLLQCARRETGAIGEALWRLRLLGLFVRFVLVAGRSGFGGLRRICCSADAKYDLPRCSLSLVADHEEVIAGAFQQLGKDLARGAGAEYSKNALIVVHALDFCAGICGNIGKNLFEAGICGLNPKPVAVPNDGGRVGLRVDRPLWGFGLGNWRGNSSRVRWMCCGWPDVSVAGFVRRRGGLRGG